jgi:hypothetical protein
VRRLWHILSGNSLRFERSLASTVRATRVPAKFCDDHDAPDKARQVRAVLAALEADDRLAAARAFKAIPFGGNGTFADWWPPAAHERETEEYAGEVFVALTVHWYELASELLAPRP